MRRRPPAPDPAGISWFLLKAKSTDGWGIFSRVNYIQRVDTEGDSLYRSAATPNHAGMETRSPYRAHPSLSMKPFAELSCPINEFWD